MLTRLNIILLSTVMLCCLSGAQAATERPRVGVVLSGGGAKGVAHIGALKVIEEAGIPIDYIVGTSMGSIIGGLYAIGYTPTQMDSIVRHQDWTALLSDQVERERQSMSEREAGERYVLSIPLDKSAGRNITGGLIKGQNIANMFSELTIGYHDSIDFNRLPTPFACIAQDIVTGKEVCFRSGKLSTAMRASMAIPGVFTPVRIDSMVLVDGGMVNNYPVDVARRMGADIVIGVDVQSDLKTADKLNGAGDILGQLINLMGMELYKKNVSETDAYIKVNVEGYSTASFTSSAIDSLIGRGEEAARSRESVLDGVKSRLEKEGMTTGEERAAYPYTQNRKIYIREIRFDGLDEKDMKWLMKRCNLKENTEISIAEIENVASTLCSNLEYSTATYTLPSHPDGGYILDFALSKKYERKLNVGLRFDSEETASLLASVSHSFRGSTPKTISLSARLGKRHAVQTDFMIETSPLRRFNLSYRFEYNDIDFSEHGDHTHSSAFRYHKAELSYANVWYRNIRYALGLRYEFYDFDKILYQHGTDPAHDMGNEQLFGAFAQVQYDTYNHACFPTRGMSIQASYAIYTDDLTKYDDHHPFSAIRGHVGFAIPVTRRFSILPDVYGRFLIGKKVSHAKQNSMGGDVAGRYFSHQLPFAGINNVEITDKSLLIGSLKLRQRMGAIHYLTLTANYALNAHKIQHIFEGNTLFGCGIGYGMDSILGPLEFSLNYVNRSNDLTYYVNLGYKF